MGFNEVMNCVVEKLKELQLAMGDFWGQFLGWFDKVFPPETRGEKLHHWLAVALPFLIVAVVLIAFFYCCCKCCGGGPRGRGFKMMKAPGRNCRMPRHVFEGNPKSYFRNLRAHPGDQLC